VAERRKEISMSQLFRFPSSVKRDAAIDAWMRELSGELGAIAQRWFEVMRDSGDDVRELLHDGHPTACVGDAAFAYVNAFKHHVNVVFFRGAEIADPKGLLEGTGKFMRQLLMDFDLSAPATNSQAVSRAAVSLAWASKLYFLDKLRPAGAQRSCSRQA
jgi:hypothetical protein